MPLANANVLKAEPYLIPVPNELLSVIIPVFNEKLFVVEVVERVQENSFPLEIILVDDGSTDGSSKLIRDKLLPRYKNITFLQHDKNQGKGCAIQTALKHINGSIVIIQDADLEYFPEDYPKLIAPIINGESNVVYGSRFKELDRRKFLWHWFKNKFMGSRYEIRYLHHFLGVQFLNLVTNILYQAKTTDEATCYKVFRADILQGLNLKCRGFEFCPEFTAKIRKRGCTIREVPIKYRPRPFSEGKKLRWTHGFKAIWTLIKYRFSE